MALSSVTKNFRDGSIAIEDGTGTPISMTVAYEDGDFSISGLIEGQKQVVHYQDRGDYYSSRKTTQVYPKFSFTAHMTELSDNTNKNLIDVCRKTGAWSAGVSTLGAAAEVWAVKITLTVEGTNHGDAADHTIVLDDCVITDVQFAEGDPNKFTISGECVGTITIT